MAVSRELVQTVAVGPFNPHIITPEWLVRYKVLPDQEVQLRLGALIDGVAFRFKRTEWQVDSRRLLVASTTEADDCGELVAKVLELLPHTPVKAVGHNFHFLCSNRESWKDSPLPLLGKKGFGDLSQLEQSRWTGIFEKAPVRIEMTVGHAEDGLVVLFNHHRNTKNIEEAKAATRHFRHDFDVSRAMLRDMLGQEIA